jgi:8-oxo-dGTP diphosphatase
MPVSEQGISKDRYMVIPRALVFLRRGEAYLLLKGAPHKRLWANKYNGVGGHIELGEDILSAAKRELFEETGLSADLRLCGTVMVDTQQQIGICIFVLTGEWAGGEPRSSEEGFPEWIDFSNLGDIPVVPDVPILLAKINAMCLGDPPFAAKSFYDESGQLLVEFAK